MSILMKSKPETSGRRGNAMLEACLTLGLFTTMLFTIYDFSWELFYHQTLVSQARAGARYGAINPSSTTAIQNVVLYNNVSGGSSGILGLTSSNVNVSRAGTAGGADDHVVVTITGYHYTTVTLIWAGTHTGTDIIASSPVEN